MSDKTQTSPDDAVQSASWSRISPKAVMDAIEDPTVFAPLVRGLGMANVIKIAELMKNPNVPLRDRMAWQEMCFKYGGVQAPQTQTSALDGVPRIQIFLHDAKSPTISAGPVIEVTSEALPAPTDD